jgi:hypothetical protein
MWPRSHSRTFAGYEDCVVVTGEASAEPPTGRGGTDQGIAWSSWPRAAWLIATGATLRTSLPVALVVGSLLSAVNQGGELVAGDISGAAVARLAANYAIPYLVSSVGYLSAHRSAATSDALP